MMGSKAKKHGRRALYHYLLKARSSFCARLLDSRVRALLTPRCNETLAEECRAAGF